MSDMAQRFTAAPTGFVAGFATGSAGVAEALARAFAVPPGAAGSGFAPRDMSGRPAPAPEGGPRHFSPADPEGRPTEGWDPFDPTPPVLIDPVTVAHAEGFAEGLAVAAAERERDMALVAELTRGLGAARMDREAMAQRLRQTVLYLVARLVGEAGVSADRLAERITAATDLLADQAESAMLRLNPADVGLVEGKLPPTIFAIGDAAVERGGFVMEAASTVVEDGPSLWLEQLAAAIDRVAVPA